MICTKNFHSSRVVRAEKDRDVRIIKVVPVTTLRGGLLHTEITHQESKEFGDEHQNYRDYSLQTLIQVQAVDLLKPFGTIQVSRFAALDSADSAFVSMSDYNEKLSALKEAADAAAVESATVESSN